MRFLNKKGLSPVIATILLVALVLVLGTIIFIWARSFVGESLLKNEGDISMSCESVAFNAEAITTAEGETMISIENIGTVSIYGIEIRKKGFFGDSTIDGVETELNEGATVAGGESGSIIISENIDPGVELLIVPILIGENENLEIKSYICDEDYGEETTVE